MVCMTWWWFLSSAPPTYPFYSLPFSAVFCGLGDCSSSDPLQTGWLRGPANVRHNRKVRAGGESGRVVSSCPLLAVVLALEQWCSTGVLQEVGKHAMSDWGALTSSPLDCQTKNDNSQYNSSCPVWMNQNLPVFCQIVKNDNSLCATER